MFLVMSLLFPKISFASLTHLMNDSLFSLTVPSNISLKDPRKHIFVYLLFLLIRMVEAVPTDY